MMLLMCLAIMIDLLGPFLGLPAWSLTAGCQRTVNPT